MSNSASRAAETNWQNAAELGVPAVQMFAKYGKTEDELRKRSMLQTVAVQQLEWFLPGPEVASDLPQEGEASLILVLGRTGSG